MTTLTDFAELEDAILALLKTRIPYARRVETYAGQMDDILDGRPVKFPLVVVMFSGESFQDVDGPNHLSKMEFSVGVFAHGLRGEEANRKDADTGAYQMVRDVKTALINARLAENVSPVLPAGIALVMASPTVAAYKLDFSISMDQEYQWPT